MGIVCCIIWKFNADVLIPLLISLALLSVLYLNNRSKFGVQQNSAAFIFISDVFLFLAAVHCCYLNDIKNEKNYYGHYINSDKQVWTGEILDLPVEKENFYKVMMEVKAVQQASTTCGKSILYLKKPFDKALLVPGTILSVKSAFHTVPEPLNPHEFDYREFLARKNIYYSSFADAESVKLNGISTTTFPLRTIGSGIKQKILNVFNAPELNKDAAQLCAALLTGYDDEISPETINAFAHSGTLHVLSVSGLHTGILYAVLIFILGSLDRNNKYKFIQLIIITFVLWGFVLVTGFSPPVLRAAIMLNLIAIGRFYYNYAAQHSLNILAVSAFLILVFDPMLILDTGFLLSYSAVAGILLFEPSITRLVNSKYPMVNKYWQLTSVSLAAQISTLPVTLLLFHQFPLWFVFSNLVVIPVCIAVMALAFLFLCKLAFLAPLINWCSVFIFFVIHLTDVPGWGYIEHIDFGWTDLMFLSALIITTALFVKSNSYRYLSAAVSLLILWQVFSITEVISKRSASHIAVYHVKKQSAVDLKNSDQLYFSDETSANNYNYHIKNNHTYINCSDKQELAFDYVATANEKFLSVGSDKEGVLIKFLKPDHILMRNNAELPEEALKYVKPKLIVADGSNNYSVIKKLKALCGKFAIPFHSTANDGYLQIGL